MLDTAGDALEFAANDGPKLSRPWLRALARLSAAVASTFGGPQDVEWAIGRDETLWLLQSRPVTSEVRGAPGPIYGPGPVAETFPEPLTELERDLGSRRCGRRCRRRCGWPGPRPTRSWRPARWWWPSTATWPST